MNGPSNGANGSDGPPSDRPIEELRAELEADRRRIAELEAENAALAAASGATNGSGKQKGSRRSHRFWVAILLIIGSVLTPITILSIFLKNQITDTDRYVQTVKPLASDPAIQAYVADDITEELFARVDIAKYVKDALPKRADVLAGPLTSALQGFVREATMRVLETDQFQTLWLEANRIAHAQLVNVLTGKETAGVSATRNGAVQIDLSSVAKLVSDQLQSTGIDLFSRIPIASIGGKITLFQSDDLYKVRRAVGVLNTVAFVLPFIVIGSFGAAIHLSKSRRRGFVLAAVAFTLGALVLGAFLFVARGLYLDAATSNDFPYDAAAAMYDTITRFLHTSVRAVLTLSLIVLIAVFFAGASRFAVWFRDRARWAANWLGTQSDDAGWDWLNPNAFVVRYKNIMRVIVAVIAFIILFRWDHPTPVTILTIAALTLVVLGIIEFFGREPSAGPPALTGSATPAPSTS